MTLKDRIKAALKESTADYCEVRLEETESTIIRFQGNDVDEVSESTSVGGNVRALKDGGWGFTSFNRLDDLSRKVYEACAQAALLGERLKKEIHLYPVDPVEDVVAGRFPKDPAEIPLQDKVNLLEGYNRLVLGLPEITSSTVFYSDKKTRVYFANSHGTYIDQDKRDIAGGLMAIATKNRLTTYDMVTFGSDGDFRVALGLEDEIRQAADSARQMLYAPVMAAGQYTAILSPDMAGLFVHEAFGHLSEADELDENEHMKELLKIGTRYGTDELSIFDSGVEGGNRGDSKYDDEGVPMHKSYLIDKGVVVGHLHSRESAWKMGEKPTGNARALNYRFPPIVRMRTTCIGPGTHTFDEMLKGISLGVYVGKGAGGETNGEMFTFAATRCHMIRNGSIAEPVRDVNLTGNVFATLNNIDMIGSTLTVKNSAGGCGKGAQSPLPVTMGSPSIRIQNVVIGGEKR